MNDNIYTPESKVKSIRSNLMEKSFGPEKKETPSERYCKGSKIVPVRSKLMESLFKTYYES